MELKTEQVENYSRLVNAFNKKLNIEMPEKLQPVMSVYLTAMQAAGCDQSVRNDAILAFSAEVHAILSNGLKDYLTIQSETLFLRASASETLGEKLSRLEQHFDESFQVSRQFLKDFIDNLSDQETITAYNETVRQKGLETKVILSDLADHLQNTLQ